MIAGTQVIFWILDVKGDATEASESDNDTPACATFKAPQSLAPSPHIPTINLNGNIIYIDSLFFQETILLYTLNPGRL